MRAATSTAAPMLGNVPIADSSEDIAPVSGVAARLAYRNAMEKGNRLTLSLRKALLEGKVVKLTRKEKKNAGN